MTGPLVADPDRLAVVHATGLLDTEAEEVFDRLTRLAVRLVGVPAAFISLVDINRDFYKSTCGFGEALSTTRQLTGSTFCHYAVQQTTPLVIPDTRADPVYSKVETVESLGVAAYVGVPLVVRGEVIGAFCTIDMKPHDWTEDEVEVLVELAASAQREIELRGAVALANESNKALRIQAEELEDSNRSLQEQAMELEAQSEELQATTAYLEDLTDRALTASRSAVSARDEANLARAEAETANRVKGEFLAVMSHELRTPLNAIGGYSDLIELGVHGPVTPEQIGAIARIKRSQRHLLGLINGLLSYAQIDAGAVSYDLQYVVLDEVITECHGLTAPQIETRQIAFEHVASSPPVVAIADRDKLDQIIVNLMGNAVKFTEPGGSLKVTSGTAENGDATIALTDTGKGIGASQLETIFLPFVQVDAKLTRAKEGTGLGLSISRNLARGMGGDITVTSTLGGGSTFLLTLPPAKSVPES